MRVETVADLVAPGADAHGERRALLATGDGPDRTYDDARLRTDAQKTGNFLSHQGVRDGRRLGVVAVPDPETVLAVLGAALTGAVVRLDPPDSFDGRAVLAPLDRVGAYDLPAGGRRIAHGGAPEDPAVVHFEEEMWSENPTFPPPSVAPGDSLLVTETGTVAHGRALSAAETVVTEHALAGDSTVALRASLARPGAVVAGVIAPLLAGATALLPAEGGDGGDEHGTHAVATPDASVPESERIDPGDVL